MWSRKKIIIMEKNLFKVLVTNFILTYFYRLTHEFNDKGLEKLVTLNIFLKCFNWRDDLDGNKKT